MINESPEEAAKRKNLMKKALNAWNVSAQKIARRVVTEATTNVPMQIALHQQAESMGINYGHVPIMPVGFKSQFGVFPMTNESGKTRFDVVNMTAQTKTAQGICLLETAEAISKYLNRGHSFYSPEINNLLELERQYVKHLTDAMQTKRSNPDPKRDAVLESRFKQSQNLAVAARNNIKKINEAL